MSKKFDVRKVHVYRMYDESPDGYGGYNSWTWYELGYEGSKKRIKLGYKHQVWSVTARHYRELTTRELTIEEMKLIFKKNKDLYDNLEMTQNEHDTVLRSVGKRTKKLELKIKAKKKLFKKHRTELLQMLRDYHGGEIPIMEKLDL